jgi:predicted outer membrane repeat protein
VLNDSQISGNNATNYGGGMLNNSARTTLNGSTVSDNTAGTDGGGIYNEIGTVTLNSGSSVTNNNPDNCAGEAISGCSG